jgi:thymidylate synthase
MQTLDQQYHALLDEIQTQGCDRIDRTKVGTRSIFGALCVI